MWMPPMTAPPPSETPPATSGMPRLPGRPMSEPWDHIRAYDGEVMPHSVCAPPAPAHNTQWPHIQCSLRRFALRTRCPGLWAVARRRPMSKAWACTTCLSAPSQDKRSAVCLPPRMILTPHSHEAPCATVHVHASAKSSYVLSILWGGGVSYPLAPPPPPCKRTRDLRSAPTPSERTNWMHRVRTHGRGWRCRRQPATAGAARAHRKSPASLWGGRRVGEQAPLAHKL